MTDTSSAAPVGRWRRLGTWLLALWRRLVKALQGPEQTPAPTPAPPPPPPGRLTERRDASAPIVVPARGYVFHFNVRATFIWSSDGLPREVLSGSAQYFMPYAIRALTRLATARSRNYPAHRARELEVELQRTLTETGPWQYERGNVQVTCQPHVWIELDDRVKQAVRPYWEQLIKLDCEHDVDVRRAQYAERLSRQWLSILEKLVGSPVADGAARMTNEHLAAVVKDLVAEQRAATRRLEDLLGDKLHSGDAFEQATSFDLLIERLGRQAGATPGQPRHASAARNGSAQDPERSE